MYVLRSDILRPHQWCNSYRVHLECSRSWVRASILLIS